MVSKTDILAVVKSRLSIEGNERDSLINSYSDEIEEKILSYCNVQVVPDGLKFVWASMVIDVLKVKYASLPEIAASIGNMVSVTVGDTTTKVTANKFSIDELVVSYRADLNAYRKMRW